MKALIVRNNVKNESHLYVCIIWLGIFFCHVNLSGEQRETNMQLLHQLELWDSQNGYGRHRYKTRLVKWLTSYQILFIENVK